LPQQRLYFSPEPQVQGALRGLNWVRSVNFAASGFWLATSDCCSSMICASNTRSNSAINAESDWADELAGRARARSEREGIERREREGDRRSGFKSVAGFTDDQFNEILEARSRRSWETVQEALLVISFAPIAKPLRAH
jgi:hypothetical protein